MADESGVIVGRIAVKVLPDTKGFRDELKDDLRTIEKSLKVVVGVELDTDGLREQLQKIKDQLQDFRKKNDPLKIAVQVDMLAGQTTIISARLAYLTRPRTVPIVPVLSEGAVGAIMSALAALSGARVLGDFFENLFDVAKEFDRLAPKIGAVSLALGGLTSLLLTSVSNTAALAVSLASIGAAFLALPGLIGGAAIGLGALISAFTQFKTVLPDVFKGLSAANKAMQGAFWNQALEPFREMANVLLPLWASGFADVGTKMGGFIGQLASGLGTTLAPLMESMFANLNEGISTLSTAAPAIANIFSILSAQGAAVIPQLATGFALATENFSKFLEKANNSGELAKWIQEGFAAISDLGSSLASIAGIFNAIGQAALAAGGSGISVLADTLNRVQAVVESPAFQTTLTQVFKTAHDAITAITLQSGPAFLQLIQGLADVFISIGPAIGNGLGAAFNAIFQALSQQAVLDAVVQLFDGLAVAIVQLAPALAPLMQAFAALVPVVVALLQVIAPLITAAIIPLAAAIQLLAPVLVPVIQMLGGALLQVVQALAPIFVMLVESFITFATTVGEALAPVFPVLIDGFLQLVTAAAPLIPLLLNLLTSVIVPLLPVIVDLATSVLPVLVEAFVAVVQAVMPLITAIIGIVNVLMPVLVPVLKIVASIIKATLVTSIVTLQVAFQLAARLITSAVNELKTKFGDALARLGAILETFAEAVGDRVEDVLTYFRELPDKIKGFFDGAKTWLIDAGKHIIEGLIDGVSGMFDSVKSKLGELTDLLPDWKGPAERDATLLTGAGQLIIEGFIDGLESKYDAVKRSLKGMTNDVEGMKVNAPSITAAVTSSLTGAGGANGAKVLNYYAAPGSSLSAEEDLFAAASRGRMVGW